jgi:hypothetical protein
MAVERELAAPVGDAKLDTALQEEVLGDEHLAQVGVSAGRDDVGVLEEEERLAPSRFHARFRFLLKREGRVPGDAAF